MPEGFPFACNATEHVFDSDCSDELLMGFEFWEIDYDIGIKGDGTEGDAGTGVRKEAKTRRIQGFNGDVEAGEVGGDTKLTDAGVDSSPCGRISDEWFCAMVKKHFGEGDQYGAMGLDGGFGGCWSYEIGLEEDCLAGLNEFIDAAEEFKEARNRGIDSGVVGAGDYGSLRFQSLTLSQTMR